MFVVGVEWDLLSVTLCLFWFSLDTTQILDPPLNCCVVTLICFGRVFPGTAAFQLYSSMGFPLDLLTLMAEEKVRFDLDEHTDTLRAGHV